MSSDLGYAPQIPAKAPWQHTSRCSHNWSFQRACRHQVRLRSDHATDRCYTQVTSNDEMALTVWLSCVSGVSEFMFHGCQRNSCSRLHSFYILCQHVRLALLRRHRRVLACHQQGPLFPRMEEDNNFRVQRDYYHNGILLKSSKSFRHRREES